MAQVSSSLKHSQLHMTSVAQEFLAEVSFVLRVPLLHQQDQFPETLTTHERLSGSANRPACYRGAFGPPAQNRKI